MFYDNNANRLRKEVLISVAKAFFAEDRANAFNRIPIEMRPRRTESTTRCCVHKDRAVIKYRSMTALGFSVEDETDEVKPLSAYFADALDRTEPSGPVLSVIDEACDGCIQTRYTATEVCRGCIARNCQSACPKGAIEMKSGRAWLNPEKCINCGLCMKACPYHAIIKISVPCEEVCPVGAISRNERTGREQIDYDKCIYCGQCLRQCPFSAIAEKSQMIDVLNGLAKGTPMAMMLAPSVTGQFPGNLQQLVTALKQLGFAQVIEVAEGADETTRHEAAELVERLEEGATFMTTSCCPAYIEAVEKHMPGIKKFVSETPSPMGYTARITKERWPEIRTVFAGPCIAKRIEGEKTPEVDYVLTFEELGAILIAGKVDVRECAEAELDRIPSREGRGFPVNGGVTEAVLAVAGPDVVKPIEINGLNKKSIAILRGCSSKGKAPGNFIEVMCCEGGCLAGPGTTGNPRVAGKELAKLKDQSGSISKP
jgi:[FeFe] hydrogenase (group B1/B3)